MYKELNVLKNSVRLHFFCFFTFLSVFFIFFFFPLFSLAVARIRQGLYTSDTSSFHDTWLKQFICSVYMSHCVRLNTPKNTYISSHSIIACDDPIAQRWHHRWGHPSEIVTKHLGTQLAMNKYDFNFPCDICHDSKQSRNPFTHYSERVDQPLQLLHIDILGTYHEKSISSTQYFLTIVDDHTWSTWVYMMQHKSQAISLLIRGIRLLEKQHDAKIKSIQTDNGLDFLSHLCQQIFIDQGILH